MDVIDKKNMLVEALNKFISNSDAEPEVLSVIDELSNDPDFYSKKLFKDLFDDYKNNLPDLPRKRLKQDILLINDYNDF